MGKEQKEMNTNKAPGKLILSGEHAVVYGGPAIVTAVNRYAHCTVTACDETKVILSAPEFSQYQEISLDNAHALYEQLQQRHQSFLEARIPITDVLKEAGEFLIFAVIRALNGEADEGGMQLTIRTDLPVGCGMGSSAAVAASIISSVRKYHQLTLNNESLFEMTMDCERLQHGYPSGIDPYASTYGGCLRYQLKQPIQSLNIPSRTFSLIHTGEPESSTGECVAQVKKNFEHSGIWSEFTSVQHEMQKALTTDDVPGLAESIRRNHRLLIEIGVVPECVQDLIASIEARGGAAKLCGAGSIRGDSAGMVWVVQGEDQSLDYPILQVNSA